MKLVANAPSCFNQTVSPTNPEFLAKFPDMVFQFAAGEQGPVNRGLDYQHCKGCLRCVAVCPVQALTAVKEREWPEKPYALPNQSLITADIPMEASGANSWMSSEAQETERRIEE